MSAANDLIERFEKETGKRLGDDNDDAIYAGILGALSRVMGMSPESYTEHEDVVVGTLIMNPEALAEKERQAEVAAKLAALGIFF